MAEECVDRLLMVNATAPFVNLAKMKKKDRGWESEGSPVDCVAGLPELLALAKITGNLEYSKRARELLSNLPLEFRKMDGSTVSFFNLLAIGQVIEETKEAKRALRGVNEFVGWTGSNETLLHPLLNVVSLLGNSRNAVHFRNEEYLRDRAIERHRPPLYTVFSPGDPRTLLSFRFDATVLLMIIREDQKRGLEKSSAEVRAVVEHSLGHCRQGVGFAGIRRANSDRVYPDNVQHSAFLGQWLKAGALVARRAEKLTVEGVFNERGQLVFDAHFLTR
jgi:hypothetical protein